jgi:nitrite reductase (NADH) small subunit/3-phenylpropionate/trans-cinnamate dioxygenase ferredoxin subunit
VADFVTVARVDEIPPGTVKAVRSGEDEFALANVEGEFCAVQAACLHLQGPLGEGHLEGPLLHCPWHGWTYDVRTGLNDFDHAIQLETFEVRVAGDEVQVRPS